jgi:hypothetical protein
LAIPPLSGGAQSSAGASAPNAANDARVAAQRAFFQAAMGRTTATTTAQAVREVQIQRPATPQIIRTEPAAEPDPSERLRRPGSLLDITV